MKNKTGKISCKEIRNRSPKYCNFFIKLKLYISQSNQLKYREKLLENNTI